VQTQSLQKHARLLYGAFFRHLIRRVVVVLLAGGGARLLSSKPLTHCTSLSSLSQFIHLLHCFAHQESNSPLPFPLNRTNHNITTADFDFFDFLPFISSRTFSVPLCRATPNKMSPSGSEYLPDTMLR